MRVICVFLFSAVLVISTQAADVLNEFKLDQIKGNPSKVTIERIICDQRSRAWLTGDIVDVEVPILGEATFPGAAPIQAQGLRYETASVKFNEDGQALEFVRTRGGELLDRTEFLYDANGRRTSLVRYGKDGEINRKEAYSYNTNGLKTDWAIFEGNGEWIEKHQYSYDEKGALTSERRQFSRPPRDETVRYRYEQDGRLVWMEHYDADNNFLVKHVKRFDDEGRLLGESYFDKSGAESGNLIIIRDDQGRVIDRQIHTKRGGLEYRGEFKVNRFGLRTEVKETGIKNRPLNHEWLDYTYDNKGNWIARGVFQRPKISDRRVYVPVSVDRRTIEYAQTE